MTAPLQVRRGNIEDVFAEDGRCAVFVNGQVVVLSEIATVILESTSPEGPVTWEEITAKVVDEYGEPEPPLDASEITRTQILDLVAHQVLVDAGTFHARGTPESVGALTDAVRHLSSTQSTPWHLPAAVSKEFIGAVRMHRLAPALSRSLDRLDLPPAVAAQLRADDAGENALVAKQAIELTAIFDALERAEVRALAFKGLALAAQAHGDHAARGKGDHDILVHPRDLSRAHAAITALGWSPGEGFARPGSSWAWRHLVRNYYELTLVRGVQSVDLHWHLGPVRAASPRFEELWDRRTTVEVGAGRIPTFSTYDALAHSAMHAAKDRWGSLRSLLDVHRLMAEPRIWRAVHRPLGHDQLLSVGLAAQLYGIPPGSPPVVAEALRQAEPVLARATQLQRNPESRELARRVPGASLAGVFAGLHRAGASPGDHWRFLCVRILPITDYTGDPARFAVTAVPRVLMRRGLEVTRLWGSALKRRRASRAASSRADKTDT